MKIWSFVAALAIASCATGTALAWERPGSATLGRIAAECTVDQERGKVAVLLRTLPGSQEEERAARHLAPTFNACGAQLRISTSSQGLYSGRAELAAATARHILSRHSAAWPNGAVTPWYGSEIAGKAPGYGSYDSVSLGLQQLGTCIFGAAPDASAKLVLSTAGSVEERAALGAIRPVLPGCVVQGKPMHMTLAQIRLLVAEPLYHALNDGLSAGRL